MFFFLNKLTLNVKNTKYMIFCHTSNKREINRSLKLNSSTLALLPGTKTQ